MGAKSTKFMFFYHNSYTLSGTAYCSFFICITLPLTHSAPATLTSSTSIMSTMLVSRSLSWLLSLLRMFFTPHISMTHHPLHHCLSSLIECKLHEDKDCFHQSSIPIALADSKCSTNIWCCWISKRMNFMPLFTKILRKRAVMALEKGCNTSIFAFWFQFCFAWRQTHCPYHHE